MQQGEDTEETQEMMPRPASTAYSTRSGGLGATRPSKSVMLIAAGLFVVGLFVVPSLTRSGHSIRGSEPSDSSTLAKAKGGPYAPGTWDIMLISDLDKKSKVDDTGKSFHSVLQEGRLSKDPVTGGYAVEFGGTKDLESGHNEAGRGMELSELIMWNDKLLTVDDRTGIVFQIVGTGDDRHMAPRFIISEGDGTVDKGMKLEWAAVKDGKLVLGSMGKEYTNSAGEIVSTNNNWVDTINERGEVLREDWTHQYTKLREAGGAKYPGYMIHESAAWSSIMGKWVFLPRRVSEEEYDEVKDEKMGSNMILIADANFRNVKVSHAGEIVPTHGFSSFKFVPETGDQVVVALKSMENEEEGTQDTFLTVLTLDGDVLLDETEVPGGLKFEGIEIFPVPASEISDADGNRRLMRR